MGIPSCRTHPGHQQHTQGQTSAPPQPAQWSSCSPAQGPESWGSASPLLQPPQLHWTSLLALPLQGWCPHSASPGQPPASSHLGITHLPIKPGAHSSTYFSATALQDAPGLFPPRQAHPCGHTGLHWQQPPSHQHFATFTPTDSGTFPSLPAPVQPGQYLTSSRKPPSCHQRFPVGNSSKLNRKLHGSTTQPGNQLPLPGCLYSSPVFQAVSNAVPPQRVHACSHP